jgi:mRNA-degrading endonuclease RelE of RelBE toxin-antitoxin system
MSYEVGFKPSALKEIRKLDEAARKVIIVARSSCLQIILVQMVTKSWKEKAIAWHFDFGSIAEIYRDIDF